MHDPQYAFDNLAMVAGWTTCRRPLRRQQPSDPFPVRRCQRRQPRNGEASGQQVERGGGREAGGALTRPPLDVSLLSLPLMLLPPLRPMKVEGALCRLQPQQIEHAPDLRNAVAD